MPLTRKDQMIAFEYPLENEGLMQFGDSKACTQAMDTMFRTFREGMEKTNSGYSAMRTLYKWSPTLGSWAAPLKEAGFFGEDYADPSVDTVVELGKKIKIVDKNGKISDFSTLFFNNPTVEAFREKEKGLTKRDKHYGNILLAYMGVFLSGKKDERFKNFSQGYGGMDPASGDTVVYIEHKDGSRQIVTDMATKMKRDEIIDKIEDAESTLRKFPKEPEIPAKPTESNIFRRFFAWIGIAKHSKEYNDRMAERDKAVADKNTYREAKETLEATMKQAIDDPLMKKAQAQQQKVEDAFKVKPKDLGKLKTKLTDQKTLKSIVNSKAPVFTEGSVSAILNVIYARPLVGEHVKGEMSEKDKEKIETFERYNHIDKKDFDNNPITEVNKFVTLVHPFKAGMFAHSAEVMGEDYRHEEFNFRAKKDYQEMVDDSKRAFKENFGIEPNPANVQAVADAFDLQKYVKYGVETIDRAVYGAEDKLPKVDETNVGDITLLLMSGIKTVAVMGNLVHDTQPKKQAGQELNIDRPALEAGHKPEENVQQTI